MAGNPTQTGLDLTFLKGVEDILSDIPRKSNIFLFFVL
jgi:hypothetical protein